MESKQTAVEWLFLMLNNPNSNQDFANKLLEQAKKIEKEQMKLIYSPAIMQNEDGKFCVKTFEQYYNETFGK